MLVGGLHLGATFSRVYLNFLNLGHKFMIGKIIVVFFFFITLLNSYSSNMLSILICSLYFTSLMKNTRESTTTRVQKVFIVVDTTGERTSI